MPRPNFITNHDIMRWSNLIDREKNMPLEVYNSPIVREVCYAGMWLIEELDKLNCPDIISVRIQWTAGKLSYGRDPWEVHQQILQDYNNNTLVFETDDSMELN